MRAGTLEELPAWAMALVRDSRVGRLGFLDGGDRPRVLPITYAMHDGAIWSAVDRKPKRPGEPARVRYLRRRPEAALAIDRYSDDWEDLAWVQIMGRVELLTPAAARGAVEVLADKYPAYRAQAPPGPLLRLRPDRILCWRALDSPL